MYKNISVNACSVKKSVRAKNSVEIVEVQVLILGFCVTSQIHKLIHSHLRKLNVHFLCWPGSKYIQFLINCSLPCSINVDTFQVNPLSIYYNETQQLPAFLTEVCCIMYWFILQLFTVTSLTTILINLLWKLNKQILTQISG